MARRWCKIPKTFLCEAPDFDKGQDCWPPCDSVFIPMCNKRYISKPKNKEMGSVSGKDWYPHVVLSCSPFFWLNSHLEHGCYSTQTKLFSLFFSTNFPTTLSISNLSTYLWLNMYFSKDADAVPTFEFPGSTGAGPRQILLCYRNYMNLKDKMSFS